LGLKLIQKSSLKIFALLSLLAIAILFFRDIRSQQVNDKGDFCLHPDRANMNGKWPPKDLVDVDLILANEFGVFHVKQINNAGTNCINPYFPVILIEPRVVHDGWIHVVYTNADDISLRAFVDYDPSLTRHPFYNHSHHFYDAPLWTYNLFFKKYMFWKGQAFAVRINKNTREMEYIGGIEWGFEILPMNLRPKALKPRALTENDWLQVQEIIK